MDKQQILEIAKNDPHFSQAVLTLEQQIGDMPITGEQLDELVRMLEFALNNPDKYPEIIAAAERDDMVEPGTLPQQFDKVALISLLVLLYGMQERAKQKSQAGPMEQLAQQAPPQMQAPQMQAPQQEGFARGGLASLGRHGDTMLAHINPREAAILERLGGSGTINPHTGLPEYFSLKKFLSIALPVALNFLAPGIGTAIGSTLGLSGTAATMAGTALIGGGAAALGGGNPLQGAVLGGLTGGLGSYVGSAANNAMNLGLGTMGQGVLGSGLIGGTMGAATGQGFLKGAAQGAAGSFLGQQLGSATGNAAIGAGGRAFGNAMAAGYDPKSAAASGALTGLATSMAGGWGRPGQGGAQGLRPSDAVVQGLKSPAPYSGMPVNGYNVGNSGVDYSLSDPVAPKAPAGYAPGDVGNGLSMPQSPLTQAASSGSPWKMSNLALGAAALGALIKAPSNVQQAVKKMSPAQQEYFNRPSVTWDWNKLQNDATANNMDLSEYMGQAWPRITSGEYNTVPQVKMARGGALARVAQLTKGAASGQLASGTATAQLAQGPGTGRSDSIPAKLSDGEYVMDAETVGMLGDGSSKAGARRLDAMRSNIRAHKGKALAKGKFSPNAKSPLNYLKGVK